MHRRYSDQVIFRCVSTQPPHSGFAVFYLRRKWSRTRKAIIDTGDRISLLYQHYGRTMFLPAPAPTPAVNPKNNRQRTFNISRPVKIQFQNPVSDRSVTYVTVDDCPGDVRGRAPGKTRLHREGPESCSHDGERDPTA